MPWAAGGTAFEFGPHRRQHGQFAALVVHGADRQAQPCDEGRIVELGLDLGGVQHIAHDVTSTLPTILRSSSDANASAPCSNGQLRSTSTCRRPLRTSSSSSCRSSRSQPLEPRICSSNGQM
ncbi:hypothetical protein G6F68_018134 [Rhizopus microsporus]|nr:hypothetical protein G6F68_018134 [Rhizopus microsporus]